MPARPQESTYEIESKVDMAKLREAVQKVFAHDPSASWKDSADTHVVRHRNRARKGSKPPVRS